MTATMNSLRLSWNNELHGRSGRIWVALAVAATFALADLWLTVYFMSTTGMSEVNPVARMLADLGPGALVSFKLLSLLVNGSILLACRKRLSGELGAWASVLVMVMLTAHWHNYMNKTHEMTSMDPAMLASDPSFVKLGV